jgi:hypothetical protein
MRAWATRVLFAGLLLGALAARIQASHEPVDYDVRPAVAGLLASGGIEARIMPSEDGALLKAVSFDAPECSGRIDVFPVRLSLQEGPLFDAAVGAGRERRIAYLGRTWEAPSRLDLRLEWLKYKVLSVLGLSPYTASTTALLIASPKGCAFAGRSIDWARFWQHAPSKS